MSLALLLSSAAFATDFQVAWLFADCHPVTGQPFVKVSVLNAGETWASTSIDLFVGLALPPSPPTEAPNRRESDLIEPWLNDTYRLMLPSAPRTALWIDVLLDTRDVVVETDDTNNHADYFVDFSACP